MLLVDAPNFRVPPDKLDIGLTDNQVKLVYPFYDWVNTLDFERARKGKFSHYQNLDPSLMALSGLYSLIIATSSTLDSVEPQDQIKDGLVHLSEALYLMGQGQIKYSTPTVSPSSQTAWQCFSEGNGPYRSNAIKLQAARRGQLRIIWHQISPRFHLETPPKDNQSLRAELTLRIDYNQASLDGALSVQAIDWMSDGNGRLMYGNQSELLPASLGTDHYKFGLLSGRPEQLHKGRELFMNRLNLGFLYSKVIQNDQK